MILRFLTIAFVLYVLFKGLGLVIKNIFGVSQRGDTHNFNGEYSARQSTSGNVDLNYDPKAKSKKDKTTFKGGEYVDFEEVD